METKLLTYSCRRSVRDRAVKVTARSIRVSWLVAAFAVGSGVKLIKKGVPIAKAGVSFVKDVGKEIHK